MFCKQCGSEINDAAVVCCKCGVPTDNFIQIREPYRTTKKDDVGQGILITGYIMALLMPIVGVIIGIYAMARENRGMVSV